MNSVNSDPATTRNWNSQEAPLRNTRFTGQTQLAGIGHESPQYSTQPPESQGQPGPHSRHRDLPANGLTKTRVPVTTLFGNLATGATVGEFLDWFEGVEEWQARAALQHVADNIDANMPDAHPV